MTIKPTTDPIAVAQTVAEFYSRNGVHGEALAEIYNSASEIAHQVVSEEPKIGYSEALAKVEGKRGSQRSPLSEYLRFKESEEIRGLITKMPEIKIEKEIKQVDPRDRFYKKISIYDTRDLEGDGKGDYILEKRFPNLGEWGTRVFDLTLTSGQKPEDGLVTKEGVRIKPGDTVEYTETSPKYDTFIYTSWVRGTVKEFSPENITFATDPSGRVIGSGVMATIVLKDGSEVIRALDDLRLVE